MATVRACGLQALLLLFYFLQLHDGVYCRHAGRSQRADSGAPGAEPPPLSEAARKAISGCNLGALLLWSAATGRKDSLLAQRSTPHSTARRRLCDLLARWPIALSAPHTLRQLTVAGAYCSIAPPLPSRRPSAKTSPAAMQQTMQRVCGSSRLAGTRVQQRQRLARAPCRQQVSRERNCLRFAPCRPLDRCRRALRRTAWRAAAAIRPQLPLCFKCMRPPAHALARPQVVVRAAGAPGQPHGRVFNFSAGPANLPLDVLEQAQKDCINWNGSGQ